ncbi:hypothetical protein cyc_04338 [Cyclospora cayetanensis]|uniref:Uncharacterized protein n=1 Tax=Cyclospora cayetanensis TaxID=88456 RepID=A0A1D3CRE3_9EIME|nr:hypothetical protein cyc_04338 [Cyclospora cayetanensis]
MQSLADATTAAEQSVDALTYPQLTDDPDQLALPGYLAKGQVYGFVVIDVTAAGKLHDRIKRLTSALKPFSEFFVSAIQKSGAV